MVKVKIVRDRRQKSQRRIVEKYLPDTRTCEKSERDQCEGCAEQRTPVDLPNGGPLLGKPVVVETPQQRHEPCRARQRYQRSRPSPSGLPPALTVTRKYVRGDHATAKDVEVAGQIFGVVRKVGPITARCKSGAPH